MKSGAERAAEYRRRKAAAAGRASGVVGRPKTAEHGDPATYNGGCRCDVCRAANTERIRRYRHQSREGK